MIFVSIATSDVFKTVGIPVLSCIVCIVAKIATRSKKQKNKTWNEWAVGVDLMVTAIILLITRSIERFSKLNEGMDGYLHRQQLNDEFAFALWSLFMVLIGFGVMITAIRSKGWKSKSQLHMWRGVILPNLIGVVSLMYIFKTF